MARTLNRIWMRVALGICATVIVTIAVLGASVTLFANFQYRQFYQSLPVTVQEELDQLSASDQDDSPRAMEIYGQYWRGDVLFGERWSLVIGLAICLPVGLLLSLWVSRLITLPLASIAEAANRIALGDLSVRAEASPGSGEIGEMVRDFNSMTDALESLERERKTTAAALSHELRTPLAVLRARLHALCDGVIEPNAAELTRLLGQVEHLGRLVDDMHTLAMADAGRLSLHIGDVELVGVATDLLDAYTIRSAGFGVTLSLRTQLEQLVVRADVDRLRQVLSNLLDNALRYGHEGGWTELAVGVDGKWAVVEVSDAGPGLPEDVRMHLFEHFHRADASRSRQTGGSGLGLSIVHALVQRMGGDIVLDESERGGAKFVIRLPRSSGATSLEIPVV